MPRLIGTISPKIRINRTAMTFASEKNLLSSSKIKIPIAMTFAPEHTAKNLLSGSKFEYLEQL